MFNDPFVGMNFSRFITFFWWGGKTFCGKDEGE